MNTRRPALFLVCAPERTRVAAYITSSLAPPVNGPSDLDDHHDHSVLLAGSSGLELNKWKHAATQRGRATCIISLSGQHRPQADVVAWPRLADKAVADARSHLPGRPAAPRAATGTPAAEPYESDQPGLFDAPATDTSPPRADRQAAPPPPRPALGSETTAATLQALKAWTPLADKSCCATCPLCGANVRQAVGWHLSSGAGHDFQSNPLLSSHARAHFLAHQKADQDVDGSSQEEEA